MPKVLTTVELQNVQFTNPTTTGTIVTKPITVTGSGSASASTGGFVVTGNTITTPAVSQINEQWICDDSNTFTNQDIYGNVLPVKVVGSTLTSVPVTTINPTGGFGTPLIPVTGTSTTPVKVVPITTTTPTYGSGSVSTVG